MRAREDARSMGADRTPAPGSAARFSPRSTARADGRGQPRRIYGHRGASEHEHENDLYTLHFRTQNYISTRQADS